MRLRRKFENASAVWRLEYQPKRGAIHFHLLVFNLPFWKQKELQETWQECTQEVTSIVDIRLIHGARSIMAYVSKYVAKVDDRPTTSLDDGSYQHVEGEGSAGRFWGWINKELLPLGEVVAGVLTDRQTIKSLSSFVWSLLGSDNPYNSISFHLFADNAKWLCERAIEQGGAMLDEWEYSTRDHVQRPQKYSRAEDHFSEAELEYSPVPTVNGFVKGERSELAQPFIKSWLARSSLKNSADRSFPYFNECGTVVGSRDYKQE